MSYASTSKIMLGALLLCAAAATADVTAGGQVRSRWQLKGTDNLSSDGHVATRTRASLKATLEGGVTAFTQWQDVRIWGEEANTLGDFNADNIDLHQGWVQFSAFAGTAADVRLGRQEIALGGQRLVGAVGWTHQGRSFDGARVTFRDNNSTFEVVAARLGDATSPASAIDANLIGIYATVAPLSGSELYVLRNSADNKTDQITAGVRKAGMAGEFAYRVEGAYQTGERAGVDVAAFLAGARLGRKVGKTNVTLWYDYLSGDDDLGDNESKVFDTLFATNHKFYGFADYFLNIPVHTAGLGLQDLAVKAKTTLRPGLSLGVDVHTFSLAQDTGVTTAHLGEEVDVTLGYDYRGAAKFTCGMSYVVAADGFADIGRLNDNALFMYVMTDVRF
jgi:hypothetical protein